ncbi:MAG: hypothetical protein LH606_12360 [Cytophagaceae bacterium]|nr:hypothetical protein [Cytophagaceae bacterium]
MKNARMLKLHDLIQEVKKTDELIKLHHSLADDNFMVEQYVARKDKLFARLVKELASPQLASPASYRLLRQLVGQFYDSTSPAITETEADLLELQQLALAS